MCIVLRNSLDIYKLITMVVILFVWMLHFLASKRLKGLIGEENRQVVNHARLLGLFALMIAFDGCISFVFAVQFIKYGNKMNDIYVIAGFEVRLLSPLTFCV
jgi:small neutral amino acid transporter SnatA (MarC family)